MIWFWIILAVIFVIIAAVFAVANFAANYMLHPQTKKGEAAMQAETDFWGFDKAVFDSYDKTKICFDSRYGYKINGYYIRTQKPKNDGKKRVVVLSHGFTSSLYGSIKYARIYLDLGFDCVVYDQRNHGDNDKCFTSMGWFEKDDLKAVCKQIIQMHKGETLIIGTHGESMGAATVMLESGEDESLSFVVEDCGYSTLLEQVKHSIVDLFHLPNFPFVYAARLIVLIKCRFDIMKVNPIDAVKKSKMPMLFMHGQADDFVPFCMQKELVNAKQNGYCEHYSFAGAAHAESVNSDFDKYCNCLSHFLQKIDVI